MRCRSRAARDCTNALACPAVTDTCGLLGKCLPAVLQVGAVPLEQQMGSRVLHRNVPKRMLGQQTGHDSGDVCNGGLWSCSVSRTDKGPDPPDPQTMEGGNTSRKQRLTITTIKDIKTQWKARYDFVLGNDRLLIPIIQGRL